jgi:hypothetical protein
MGHRDAYWLCSSIQVSCIQKLYKLVYEILATLTTCYKFYMVCDTGYVLYYN